MDLDLPGLDGGGDRFLLLVHICQAQGRLVPSCSAGHCADGA
jgi:hypothetical protein